MGKAKTEQFSKKQNEIARLTKALGHPARIAIVEHLMKIDSCICGKIVSNLPLAQPTVSQHLKALKNAGVINGEIKGAAISYSLDKRKLKKINDYLSDILGKTAEP